MTLNEAWGRVPSIIRVPLIVIAVVGIPLLLWFYGAKAWNGVGNFMYHHSENDAKKEIGGIKTQLVEETKLANQAVAAYEASKAQIAEEKKRREIAESILADKTKTTNEKLAAYETAVSARPTITGPESDAELCKRAAALGLAVQCN